MQAFYKFWENSGKRIVLGEGNPHAPWWIVTDDLTKDDEKKGSYFSRDHKIGMTFHGMMEQARINPLSAFVTAIHPVAGYEGDPVESAFAFQDFMERYKPKRVLAMGSRTLAALTGKAGIEDWRGSPFPTKWGGYIVPTLNPMAVALKKDKVESGSKYTYGSARMSFVLDTSKCFHWPNLNPPSMQIHTSYEADQALAWLEKVGNDRDTPLAFDIETVGQHIDICGFASSAGEAYVFPMGQKAWGYAHYKLFQQLLQFALRHPKLVGQNAAFDKAMLQRAGFFVAPLWFDTRVAQAWVYPDLPGDLHYMVSIYTTQPHYKWMIDDDRFLYNGYDCCLTYAVMNELSRRIAKMEGTA